MSSAMKRRVWCGVVCFVLLNCGLVIGCANARGPRTVEVSQAQLLQAIAQRMPLANQGGGPLNWVSASPRLKMQPADNRVAMEVELRFAEPLSGQVFPMVVATSYGLRVDHRDNTVRLSDLKIDGLQWGATPVLLQAPLNQVVTRLVEDLFNDWPVYTFTEKDLGAAARWGYRPGAISVKPNGLSLALLPQER